MRSKKKKKKRRQKPNKKKKEMTKHMWNPLNLMDPRDKVQTYFHQGPINELISTELTCFMQAKWV